MIGAKYSTEVEDCMILRMITVVGEYSHCTEAKGVTHGGAL